MRAFVLASLYLCDDHISTHMHKHINSSFFILVLSFLFFYKLHSKWSEDHEFESYGWIYNCVMLVSVTFILLLSASLTTHTFGNRKRILCMLNRYRRISLLHYECLYGSPKIVDTNFLFRDRIRFSLVSLLQNVWCAFCLPFVCVYWEST